MNIFIILSNILLVVHYLQYERTDKFNTWLIVLGYFALFINYIKEYSEKEKLKNNNIKDNLKEEMNHGELIGYSLLLSYYIITITDPMYKNCFHSYNYFAIIGFMVGIIIRLVQTKSKLLYNIEYMLFIAFYTLYAESHIHHAEYFAVSGALLYIGYYWTIIKLK